MLMKLLALLFVAVSIEAVAMISLSSSQFEETIAELSKKKPYLLKSPNDASVVDMEKNLHGKEAKNLVDLALSLNLTTLVSALEETGLDNIIDHEGNSSANVVVIDNIIFISQASSLCLLQPMRHSRTSRSGRKPSP